MAIEWGVARISDVAVTTDYVANGSFESLRRNVTYKDSPDYAILVRLVDHNATWNGPFVYVDKASYDFLRKSSLVPGDIVIANVGANAGTVFRVPSLRAPMTLGPNAILCRPMSGNVLNRDFLYYYLSSTDGQELLHSIRSGSAQPKFNKTDLRALPIPVPPLGEQRAIAHILGTLDDKIELNRRMSETLEAIARALFKAWFVDFDPVRAKSEGRDHGLPPHLADLFLDSFEDSELGEIPTGWQVSGLDEIATYLNGLALQKYPPGGGGKLPVIKIAQLRSGHTDGADQASADIPPAYVVEDGDVLFSWSGSLEAEIWCGGRGALNQHLFKITSDRFPRWFYFLWTRHHLADFRGIAAGKATTMGHIQRGHLSAAKAVLPPAALLEAMTERFQPLLEDLVAVRLQSRTIAALRDALLPKLISGQISVSDAEPFRAVAG
jgi:type I restriction enzyme S subunit